MALEGMEREQSEEWHSEDEGDGSEALGETTSAADTGVDSEDPNTRSPSTKDDDVGGRPWRRDQTGGVLNIGG